MKKIDQIREHYDLITEKEASDLDKLTALIRAGLFDAKKLPLLKRAMEKNPSDLTLAERKVLLELLDSLMAEVLHSPNVYNKVKSNVRMDEAVDLKRDYLTKLDTRQDKQFRERDMPYIIVLKRKGIRYFTDVQKVGLYYSQQLDRYISIPFTHNKGGHFNAGVGDMSLNESTGEPVKKDSEKEDDKKKTGVQRALSAMEKRKQSKQNIEKLASSKKLSDMTGKQQKYVRRLAVKKAFDDGGKQAPEAIGYALGSLLAKKRKTAETPKPETKQAALPKSDAKPAAQIKHDNVIDGEFSVVKDKKISKDTNKALPKSQPKALPKPSEPLRLTGPNSKIRESFQSRLEKKRVDEGIGSAIKKAGSAVYAGAKKAVGKAIDALADDDEDEKKKSSGSSSSREKKMLDTPEAKVKTSVNVFDPKGRAIDTSAAISRQTDTLYRKSLKETFKKKVKDKQGVEEGINDDLDDNSMTSLAKDLTPGLGTARAAKRTKNAWEKGEYGKAAIHALDTAVSGASDAALASGVGAAAGGALKGGQALVKGGIKAAGKLLGKKATKEAGEEGAEAAGKQVAKKAGQEVEKSAGKELEKATSKEVEKPARDIEARNTARRNKAERAAEKASGGKGGRAGRWMRRGAAAAAGAGALAAGALGGAASSSSGSGEGKKFIEPGGDFNLKAKVVAPETVNTNRAIEKQTDTLFRKSLKESVISQLKQVSDNNLNEVTIMVDGNNITINSTIANKILSVYESVNNNNKKKIDQMLNESVDSFKKVLSFAVRQ